jgi:hypothetical protein
LSKVDLTIRVIKRKPSHTNKKGLQLHPTQQISDEHYLLAQQTPQKLKYGEGGDK